MVKTNNKIALITGITGQDGSYLAELLLLKGYDVHGIIRRSSSFNTQRIENIYQDPHIPDSRLHLHYGDVTDALSIDMIMQKVKPNEIYHLGAQSHVHVSFDIPGYTAQTDAVGTLNMLEAMRKHAPNAKLYNAATSELFGINDGNIQNENTPFYPRSPYGCAKLYSYAICRNYRESYGLFVVNGILFNHESERRGSTFVTQKTVEGLVKYLKDGTTFYLGNLEAKRDWGYAKDFVYGMYLMLQQEKPEDFVLATGETHTIKEFINECLKYMFKTGDIVDMPSKMPDKDIIQKMINTEYPETGIFQRYEKDETTTWGIIQVVNNLNLSLNTSLKIPLSMLVKSSKRFIWKKDEENRDILWDNLKNKLVIGIDPKYYRAAEVSYLQGDATKAKQKLGWEPKVKFKELVSLMMNSEINKLR